MGLTLQRSIFLFLSFELASAMLRDPSLLPKLELMTILLVNTLNSYVSKSVVVPELVTTISCGCLTRYVTKERPDSSEIRPTAVGDKTRKLE